MIFSLNQRKLIGLLITDGPQSRKALASKLHLTNAAVTVMTQSLIEEGFVVELGEIESGKVGRKETLIDLGIDKYVAIGMDVRSNYVNLSFTDIQGNLLEYKKIHHLEDAVEYVQRAIAKYPPFEEISVLCRGYKGLDFFDQTIEEVERLMSAARLPYRIVHNVSALAILHKFYHPMDSNFLLVKYGPGVGSAIMTNGQLLRNDRNRGSEFGHMLVDGSSPRTLEEEISYATVAQGIEESEVVDYLLSSKATLDFVMSKIAYCLVNAHVLLALEKIVIAGSLFVSDEAFASLKDKINKHQKTIQADDLVRISDYQQKEKKIGSIVTLYYQFLNL